MSEYKAIVQSVSDISGNIHIILIYTNDKEKKSKEYVVTTAYQNLAWLKAQVKTDLENLNNIDPEIISLQTGPFDPNS